MEGLTAIGTQIIIAVPQGWNGFDQPSEISIESWKSDEVDMIVLWKSIGPRSGESTWKLTNVSRQEPDPALFRLPPGFALDDRTYH